MTPAERRAAYVKLLAEIDQSLAEVEVLASQPVLSYDEEVYLAVQIDFRRRRWSGWRRCWGSCNDDSGRRFNDP